MRSRDSGYPIPHLAAEVFVCHKRVSGTRYELSIPHLKIPNPKCFECHHHSTPDPICETLFHAQTYIQYRMKLLFVMCVQGMCETEMSSVTRLGSQPQDMSLCTCKYSKTSQSLKSQTFLAPGILDRGYSSWYPFLLCLSCKLPPSKIPMKTKIRSIYKEQIISPTPTCTHM